MYFRTYLLFSARILFWNYDMNNISKGFFSNTNSGWGFEPLTSRGGVDALTAVKPVGYFKILIIIEQ